MPIKVNRKRMVVGAPGVTGHKQHIPARKYQDAANCATTCRTLVFWRPHNSLIAARVDRATRIAHKLQQIHPSLSLGPMALHQHHHRAHQRAWSSSSGTHVPVAGLRHVNTTAAPASRARTRANVQAADVETAASTTGRLFDPPQVMVNSCSGRMGHATAEAVVRAGLPLVPFTLTGYSAGVAVSNIGVSGIPVERVGKERRQEVIEQVKLKYPSLLVIDYTTPSCVNDNAAFYAANGIPFIMGTTGGDRERVLADARAAGVYAVVAPQMGKQVVAFQAMMELMADNFPGVFSGYTMDVVESHQSSKADTSGTARAVVQSFQRMGVDYPESKIRKLRNPMAQMEQMGVPEDALGGHAFHTYTLVSPDNSVTFQFKHNVIRRRTYAEGTVDAVLFLAKKIREGTEQRQYNMVDVLREGALR